MWFGAINLPSNGHMLGEQYEILLAIIVAMMYNIPAAQRTAALCGYK